MIVPELLVADLTTSLDFWCKIIGFEIKYERPEEKFAYLSLSDAEVMLEERDPSQRQWLTGDLVNPKGRGINFQIDVPDIQSCANRIKTSGQILFMDMETKSYRVKDKVISQKQFLVQDPDGYLLRLCQEIST